MLPRFRDRLAAGEELAELLSGHAGDGRLLVLGLPRGGIPVAWRVARRLRAPLDALVVRKVGAPRQPELALGAIAPGVRVLDERLAAQAGVGLEELERIADEQEEELRRRERVYRGVVPALEPQGCTVIVVDDGLATGSTMLAAIRVLRRRCAARVVVGVPVAAAQSVRRLAQEADEVACVLAPGAFRAVGEWYADFSEVTEAEVTRILRAARSGIAQPARERRPSSPQVEC